MAVYIVELRRLAEFCNYGGSLNKMIRDRLVCGVNNEAIQRKLLAERDLTYERALAIAQGSEGADKNLREMRTVKQEPVNKLQTKFQTPRQHVEAQDYECYRCGGSNGTISRQTVNFEHLLAEIVKVCRSKTKSIKTVEDEAEVDYEDLLNAVKSPTGRIPIVVTYKWR